jgi:hypothetical protein
MIGGDFCILVCVSHSGVSQLEINSVADMFKCWQSWCRIYSNRTVMLTTTTSVSTTVEPSKTCILWQQKAFWYADREYLNCKAVPMPVLDTLDPKCWELFDCPLYSPALSPITSMHFTVSRKS